MTPQRFALIKTILSRRQPDLTVLADGIHKTHNIAAVLRTCDATGVLDVHAVSPGGEIPRHHATTAGASRWTRLHNHPDIDQALDTIEAQGYQLLAAHRSDVAVEFRTVDYCQPTAVILGTELEGVCDKALERAHQHIFIPMNGMVESLNVSVAAALVLYEAQRQRQHAGMYDTSRIPVDRFERILFEWTYPKIARRCRETHRDYPALDENGQMTTNPLAN
ncbi:MAG: tRNA (guanosine(18)-2'-O)-methyltransferase TrmH [Gammaproteobacteria bacterium]|nr:tRNA (guanosine(18)-2'-O)-methyltransferase TrmH [Gammaproteobacteria bacterium]